MLDRKLERKLRFNRKKHSSKKIKKSQTENTFSNYSDFKTQQEKQWTVTNNI